jgi:hypothetical protein
MDTALPLAALLGLGALHGINPGMGWLFAVSLGLQRQERSAVGQTLGPLAMGHAVAVGIAVAAMLLAGRALPPATSKMAVTASLIGMGVYRLVRHRHFRYGGMQVNARQLTVWSFLMASGHGAGLMVLPLITGGGAEGGSHAHHAVALATMAPPLIERSRILAALVHTAGYLLVTGVIAVLVYEELGLRLLRSAWINLDLIWAVALILTGVATMSLPWNSSVNPSKALVHGQLATPHLRNRLGRRQPFLGS